MGAYPPLWTFLLYKSIDDASLFISRDPLQSQFTASSLSSAHLQCSYLTIWCDAKNKKNCALRIKWMIPFLFTKKNWLHILTRGSNRSSTSKISSAAHCLSLLDLAWQLQQSKKSGCGSKLSLHSASWMPCGAPPYVFCQQSLHLGETASCCYIITSSLLHCLLDYPQLPEYRPKFPKLVMAPLRTRGI